MNSIFDYTLRTLTRHGLKNVAIAFIFALLVWFLASVIFITNSIKHELKIVANATPELLLNRQIGGRYYFLNENDIEPLWEIPGVSYVKGRVWGQYFLKLKNIYITLVGIKVLEEHYNEEITKVATMFPLEKTSLPQIIISKNMYNLLSAYRQRDNIISLEKTHGGFEKLKIAGFYKSETQMLSNDVILMPEQSVRNILGISKGEYVDAILKVPNPNEVAFIATKIMYENPSFKVTTKDEIKKDYELLYQFKNGWFLMLFSVCLALFAIILYDKVSGLRSEEKKEIGILKALGWEINHIIYYKLLESAIISISAFFIGLCAALAYVYFLDAPGLKSIFVGYSQLKQPLNLQFVFDIKTLSMLFFVTIPFYMGVCIIPSWKAATNDPAEIIR